MEPKMPQATREQLVQELEQARQRITELENSQAPWVQGEASAQKSQQLLQTFLDNFPDGACIKDLEGHIIMANRKMQEALPAPGGIIGKTNYDLMPKQAADATWASEKRVLETGEASKVEELAPEKGELRAKLAYKFPLKDQEGETWAVGIIVTDITELKQAEAERERLQKEVIEAQGQALQELSTPVIPIMDTPQGGIIIMPLIGSIDSMRAKDITRALLAGIRKNRARVVILDVTGVPIVDSGIAGHLNKTIQAAQLKGARVIVTGISEAVAETIVDLGIDWSGLETLADLQTGLVVALSSLGVRLKTSANTSL